MLLFWHAKLVLLAVPKTGTTALEAALLAHADTAILNPPEQKHLTARRWRNHLAPFFETRCARRFETMAIIREPRDWLGVTSRKVVWLLLEQLRLDFVPVLHRLQGRPAAQG